MYLKSGAVGSLLHRGSAGAGSVTVSPRVWPLTRFWAGPAHPKGSNRAWDPLARLLPAGFRPLLPRLQKGSHVVLSYSFSPAGGQQCVRLGEKDLACVSTPDQGRTEPVGVQGERVGGRRNEVTDCTTNS